jgi:hypothetical protein
LRFGKVGQVYNLLKIEGLRYGAWGCEIVFSFVNNFNQEFHTN